MKITPIETGCKIQLPSEWVNEFGLEKLVALEKTSEGILVHLPPPQPDGMRFFPTNFRWKKSLLPLIFLR